MKEKINTNGTEDLNFIKEKAAGAAPEPPEALSRAAIEALAKTLGDGKSRFAVAHGDLENLKKTAYLLVLVWSIVKSSLTVARMILNRRIPLQKTLTTVEIDLRTDMARMVLANSITLTPGTITVQVEGRRFTVHCLSRELLNGIESGAFVRLLRRMEG